MLPVIISATLLTVDEVEDLLSQKDCYYSEWWWTRSPGGCSDSVIDLRYKIIHYEGSNTAWGETFVRPALNITGVYDCGLKIGDTFVFGGKTFKVISCNLAFCLEDIGQCCFREDFDAPDANIYDASDVKRFIDKWFEEALTEQVNTAMQLLA